MKTHCISDYELVNRFIQGNYASLEQLINRYRKNIFTYIVLMVKNQTLAEDLFQDTFLKVITSLKRGKYQDNGKFLSWVLRIAHNLIIDHFRKENKLNVLSNDDYEVDIYSSSQISARNIEDNMVKTQITKEIRYLIESLPPAQKEVVIMRHYLDMSFKEIADYTNVSINTALGRMRYALINLKKLAEEKNLTYNC